MPEPKMQYTYDQAQRISLNAFVEVEVNGEYLKVQVTARHGAQKKEIVDNFNQLVDALSEITTLHPVTNKPMTTPQTTSTPSKKTYAGTSDSFEVSNIKLASGGEHPRWVVQGGHFTKYGVTCWPEVLKEAGILDKLDPVKDNNPKGSWVAHYFNDEEGKPKKVTKLEPKSAPVTAESMDAEVDHGVNTPPEDDDIPW